MCRADTPAVCSNSASARCWADPVPEEPKLTSPDFFFKAASSPCMEVDDLGLATSTCGVCPTSAIAAKSRSGEKPSLGFSAGAMPRALMWPIIRVFPSAGALATSAAAIRPAAPGLFSTMTGMPHSVLSLLAMMRARMSVPPPAEKPTRILTGPAGGLPWAKPGWAQSAPAAATVDRNCLRCMVCLLFFIWAEGSYATLLQRPNFATCASSKLKPRPGVWCRTTRPFSCDSWRSSRRRKFRTWSSQKNST